VQHKPEPVQQKPDAVQQKPGLVQQKPDLFSILRTLRSLRKHLSLCLSSRAPSGATGTKGEWDRGYAFLNPAFPPQTPRFAIPPRGGDLPVASRLPGLNRAWSHTSTPSTALRRRPVVRARGLSLSIGSIRLPASTPEPEWLVEWENADAAVSGPGLPPPRDSAIPVAGGCTPWLPGSDSRKSDQHSIGSEKLEEECLRGRLRAEEEMMAPSLPGVGDGWFARLS